MDNGVGEDRGRRRCSEHMVTKGVVDRSKKVNGIVERTRRCGECGTLFKTFEMTDDKLAYKQAQHDTRVKGLKCDLKYYSNLVEAVQSWFEMELQIRGEMSAAMLYEGEEGD